MKISTIFYVGLSIVLCFVGLANAINYPPYGIGGKYGYKVTAGVTYVSYADSPTPLENSQKPVVPPLQRGSASDEWKEADLSSFVNSQTLSSVFFQAHFPALHVLLRVGEDQNSNNLDLGSYDRQSGQLKSSWSIFRGPVVARQSGQFKSSWSIFRGPVVPLMEYSFETMEAAEQAFGEITKYPRLAHYEQQMVAKMMDGPLLHTKLDDSGRVRPQSSWYLDPSPPFYTSSPFPVPTTYDHTRSNDGVANHAKASILIIGSYARGEINPSSGRIKDMNSFKLTFPRDAYY